MSKSDDNQWIRLFEIQETRQDTRGGHTLYKLVYKLFPKNGIEPLTEVIVWKRFNDIKQLHKALQKMHQGLHLKGTFPKLPDSRIFGRFNEDVIEERKKAALELLEFVSKFSILSASCAFENFFAEGQPKCVDPAEMDPAQPLEPSRIRLGESSTSLEEGSTSLEAKKFGHQRCFSEPPKISHEEQQLFDPLLNGEPSLVSHNESQLSLLCGIQIHSPSSNSNDSKTQANDVSKLAAGLESLCGGDTCDGANKQIEDSDAQEPEAQSNLAVDTYIVDAATLISQAKQHENSQEYEASFESYKCAVGILLQGAKNEADPERQKFIKRKTKMYLSKAEQIYEECIKNSGGIKSKWAPDSPFKFYPQLASPIGNQENVHSLKHLNVLDVIENVQLVKNSITNQTYVIKVIAKPPSSKSSPRFPREIPNMVQLYRVYETNDAYFLLLQYTSGGKLWEHVFGRSLPLLSPCPDCTFLSNHCDDVFQMQSSRSLTSITEDLEHGRTDEDEESEPSRLNSYTGSLCSIDSLELEGDGYARSYVDLCNSYLQSEEGSTVEEWTCVQTCKSKPQLVKGESKTDLFHGKKNSQRQKISAAAESLGITSLLHKAKVLLKNADEALRQTRLVESFTGGQLKSSKSEMNISKSNKLKMSEVFHQLEAQPFRNEKRIAEERCKQWLFQIANALSQLHNLGICYYNLSPSSILYDANQEQPLLTYKCNVSDYPHLSNSSLYSVYCAPEFFTNPGKVNYQADWWSFGAVAYELLTYRSLEGFFPNGITTFNCDRVHFPDFLSIEAKDFVSKLLQFNPAERLGRYGDEEVLTHPFFSDLEATSGPLCGSTLMITS